MSSGPAGTRRSRPSRRPGRNIWPQSRRLAHWAAARFGQLLPVTGCTPLPGAGVRGVAGGHTVTVGSPALFAEQGLTVPVPLRRAAATAEDAGQTAVLAGWDGAVRAVLVVTDGLRPGSAAAVARIQRLGLAAALLTGDSERTAQAVAAQLKIPKQNVLVRRSGPEGPGTAVPDLTIPAGARSRSPRSAPMWY